MSSSHAPYGAEGARGVDGVNGADTRRGYKPRDEGTSPRRGSGRPGIALAIMLSAQLMIILDMTVVNIALPHIQANLHFSATSLSWVLNGYVLTSGGLLLLGGRAGDILGRRRTFIAGISLFTLASLAGGLSTTASLLIAARARAGSGRRARRARRARPDRDQFPGRPGTDPRARDLHGRDHRRLLARPGARRDHHRMAVLAVGAVHQRADRHRGGSGRAAFRRGDASPAWPLRPGRGPHRHDGRDRARVRVHPRLGRRMG